VALRYFIPIGCYEPGKIIDKPKGKPEGLISYITRVIKGNFDHFRVLGNGYNKKNGTAIRGYIDVNSLAAYTLTLEHHKPIHTDSFHVFNIGTEQGHSTFDVLRKFKKQGNEIKYKIYLKREGILYLSMQITEGLHNC